MLGESKEGSSELAFAIHGCFIAVIERACMSQRHLASVTSVVGGQLHLNLHQGHSVRFHQKRTVIPVAAGQTYFLAGRCKPFGDFP